MTTYGYARVSTRGQQRDGNGLGAQRAQLLAAGCSEVAEEAFSARAAMMRSFVTCSSAAASSSGVSSTPEAICPR